MPDEEVRGIVLKGDPTFDDLRATHPEIIMLPGDGAVEPPLMSQDGGVEVTYQFQLLDGCHACEKRSVAGPMRGHWPPDRPDWTSKRVHDLGF
jgi:hypothetical protein